MTKAASWMAVLSLCLTMALSAGAARGENLLKNSSFEELQDTNQFGISIKEWHGNIYEGAGRFFVGTIAHEGKSSFGMMSDAAGKIRLMSPEVNLEPGRYRVNVFVRGLSVKGKFKSGAMDFCIFGGNFMQLQLGGTFGWTPITYVFEVAQAGKARLFVGVIGGGWLWADDATLEKVDDTVELTKAPVIGKQEAAIEPPAKLGADAVHCSRCAFLNDKAAQSCYACGNRIAAVKAADQALARTLQDFEDGRVEPWTGAKIADHKGGKALSITGIASISKPQDWSGFDYLKFDVTNPTDDPQGLDVEVRDALTRGYWTRVNLRVMVPPGDSVVTLPTNMYVGEKSRPGRPLEADKVVGFFLNSHKNTLILDNFRLENLDVSKKVFAGLKAFDFGDLVTPVMEGYTQVTTSMEYEPGRGFGWDKADLWRAFNAFQPDALYQDFICPRGGNFRVDLPNGKYHVIMNIDSPGGYWGEVQVYSKRTIKANGKDVVAETMNVDDFTKKYFRYAHQEDLPGIDTFAQYVQPMFNLKEFDVEVTNGKLDLTFQSGAFGISLSSLVIYPQDKADAGKAFWAWTTERRKIQFDDYFRQINPKRKGSEQGTDPVVFARYFMQPVGAFDGPQEGDALPADGLKLTVAKGEEHPLTFSIQPGTAGKLGKIDVQVSDLAGANGAKLPAAAFPVGYLDFRITRVAMDGTVYSVTPRYWQTGAAPAGNVTRTFWIRSRPAADAAAGTYSGKITIKAEGGFTREIPLTVTVLPFALDKIADVAVGPWGCGIGLPFEAADPKKRQWDEQMFEKSLDALADGGCSSFSGRPHISVKAAAGKIELDTTRADKEMALARSKGFNQMISSYGVGLGVYQMYGVSGGVDVVAAKNAGFSDAKTFLKSLYTAVDEHAVKNNWLKIAWNLCDEPLEAAIPGSVANAQAHREIADGLKLTTFMGATSMQGKDPKNPHFGLVKALPIPSLNGHDEESLEVVKEAGNKFSFYNGGNRWTYGRYMKMLVEKHGMVLRLSWHFNIAAGDPYYALDCREDDYCWYNTDQKQAMIPSVQYLGQIMMGLSDYRYLVTLQRLVKEKGNSPAAVEGKKVLDEMINLTPGKDRGAARTPKDWQDDRAKLAGAIEALLK